jgi:Flp pilus assembly protein TadD
MRARALLDLGRPQAALLEVEKALGGSPSSADALQLHGLCLLHLDRHDDALRSLHAAIAMEPEEAHHHYLVGYTYGDSKRRQPAEQALREALRLAPEEPVYLRALAELLIERHRAGGSEAAQPAPTSASSDDQPGPSGNPRRLLDEALRHARLAVELGPERASNHITLGYVSSACGDRIAARACYEQALRIDPNNALAWNNLGCVDLAQGRPMQARERFRESLRLDPEGRVAKENLKLVAPSGRPPAIYKDYLDFERQLLSEVWDGVLFGKDGRSDPAAQPSGHAARTQPVGVPLSPKQFWRNYFFPKKFADDPRLHATALLWATEFRTLPSMLWRMPQILVWLGASLSLLRLGPAGVALVLTSNAATYLLSRKPLRRRFVYYRDELGRIRQRWDELQDGWLRGELERPQRDAAIDRLLEDFASFVESLRERLHAEESAEP